MNKAFLAFFLILTLSCLPHRISPQTGLKATGDSSVHNLNTGLSYTTIQEAIDAPETMKGDTIEVDSGIYFERVIVTKSITLVGESNNTTIIDGNGRGPVVSIANSFVTISNFTMRNAGTDVREYSNPSACIAQGIFPLHDSKVENNVLLNAVWGILMHGASSVDITNNVISNTVMGIDLGASYDEVTRNVTISNNFMRDFESFGTVIDGDSQYCNVVNNTVENGFCGIVLGSNLGTLIAPSNNLVEGNTLANNVGMNLLFESKQGNSQESYTNTFRRNSLRNTGYHNLVIWGYNVGSFIQDIDSSNMVNNKGVYYLTNLSNAELDPGKYPDVGYLALVNCTNVTVKDLDLSENNDGLLLAGSTGCTVTNVTLGSNYLPVLFPSSQAYPKIYGGLNLFESYNNTIVNSRFYNDSYGVGLYHSDWNVFCHNSFINNGRDVISDYSSPFQNISSGYLSTNSWDNGLEGNHWNSYTAADEDNDGIGDAPYVIDANNTDHCPLMGTFSEFNLTPPLETEKVTAITNSIVSNLGLFTWSGPPHDGLQPGQPFIRFFTDVENVTVGFCRLMIPTMLLNGSTYIVLIDSQLVNATELPISNGTYVFLYFMYLPSTHEVYVTIPEVSPFVLAFFIVSTLFGVMVHKNKKRETHV
jgi:parallel beta-helix repeat protein